ncbi:ATP-binding cassette sub-family G member 4-like [Daktulosphaira vitifoliae]|uniref:ATP-binding cassette sub-family G member 4-like n=1 Tax=Daktulosphaira vitifoliae TaxID=58002 RepID=UPI0021A99427|nr:ATP-binding cassette sub-family G member 4-like [Daktulosphaira vitifoliae]XP_050541249.1 ATP-binding cassette sub-family G member 4-like [Daktulosphaira vitifoliae]XP_050541250.1 ATP-binding cassette sub-family G member 4-like [Daktulosphaira vitifoliae]
MDIEFTNLTCSVHCFQSDLKIKKKVILNAISGKFLENQLCAIIGSSGCGKTTLLNILSGYRRTGFTGAVMANNKPRVLRKFKKKSCYIMQDNSLHGQLTVRETMEFAIKLKYSVLSINRSNIEMMNGILSKLGLYNSYDTMVKYLSGGQRKKLSIALELIHNPKIMFFDEPTSGLDSSSSKQVIQIMKGLANSGQTIVCSIHQVSPDELQKFDVLYVLSPSGYCIYNGHTSALPNFLAKNGLKCPLYHNIADFILEVSHGEYGDYVLNLTKCSKNGRLQLRNIDAHSYIHKDKSTEIVSPILFLRKDSDYKKNKKYINYINQCFILLYRNFVNIKKEKYYEIRLITYALLGIMYGVIFYGIGNDASCTQDNIKFLFNCLIFTAFTSCSTIPVSFAMELEVAIKEHFNQWYSLSTFFFSHIIVDLPIQVMCTLLFSIITYYLSNQIFELSRFALFTLILTIVGLLAQAVGVFVTILFRNLTLITLLSNMLVLPWVLFSGILVKISDTPKFLSKLYDISYFKHGMEALMHSIYGHNRPNLKCTEVFCYYSSPTKVLKDFDMPDDKYWTNFLVLTAMYLFLKFLTYQILKRKLKIHW